MSERLKTLVTDANGVAYPAENQPFSRHFYYDATCFDLDTAEVSHTMLGFGVSLTEASCYLLSRLEDDRRAEWLRNIFSPDGLNLSIVRMNVGSSDYSTEVYSYNDVPDDIEMKHFSIEHDEAYVIPVAKEVKALRDDLFMMASPWSPPGWMKTGGEMCGGEMRHKYLPAFANYYVEYLKAYREHGLLIDAITMQNEVDTDQIGRMPQSRLHPDFEMELCGYLMPPRLTAAGLNTKIWLYDHNYNNWKRVMYMLSDPEVKKHVDAVAWHPYCGCPEMIRQIREAHPGLPFQLTEKGPNIKPNSAEQEPLWWAKTISGALNNGCASFIGWNCALDENGQPNTGDFECAGLVEIHSQTGEITPSVQYHAFKHFAPYIKRGAELLHCYTNKELPAHLTCVVCRNPDKSYAAVMSNSSHIPASIQFKRNGEYLRVLLRPKAIVTITF